MTTRHRDRENATDVNWVHGGIGFRHGHPDRWPAICGCSPGRICVVPQAISGTRRWAKASSNSHTSQHLGAGLQAARGPDGVGLLPVAVHGLAAVVGRGGHGATGGAVDEQAGRAEPVQLFHGRERGHFVDIDGAVDRRGSHAQPGGAGAGTGVRGVVAVHDEDFPFLDQLVPPRISTARSRITPTGPAAARIAALDSHELVAMQRPESRSTSRDRPMHPSIRCSAGSTSSRMCAMPASMDSRFAWTVVERAYTITIPFGLGAAPG